MTTLGVFEILADDGEKYHFRKLTVRCTRCGAVAERTYASVISRQGVGCQHCPRRLAKRAIVELLRTRGPLKRLDIERSLPEEHRRREKRTIEMLDELIGDGEIVRFHPMGWYRTWMYDAVHR